MISVASSLSASLQTTRGDVQPEHRAPVAPAAAAAVMPALHPPLRMRVVPAVSRLDDPRPAPPQTDIVA
jgi:hypothetical protein